MAEYDLTAKLSRYFDPHLVFPLLEFLSGRNIFDERELVQAKYDLLQKTSMVDFQLDIHRKLHTDRSIPGELTEKREQMLARYEQLSEAVQPLVKAVLTEEAAQLISREHDSTAAFDFLEKEFDIERTMVDDLYTFARHVYDCGEYSRAAINLGLYRALVPNDDKNMISCLWGKLASEILMKNWEEAFRDLNQLKAAIESSSFRSPSSLLHQRTWFIHWSLFVYFNYPQGLDGLIELFLGSPASVYLNTLQTTSPHLLRYLATAVIINRQKRTGRILRELVKIIEQECYAYRDPITEFLRCVYVQIDFDGTQQKLRECADALSNDFFLTNYSDEFVENARLLIFETYCRIHHRISIDLLAEKLNMNSEEAERWLLNLVRNTDLDAKLDSEEGVVVMGLRNVQPWQTVIERTKNLFNRTENLVHLSERKKDTNARWQTYQPREPQTTNEMTPLIE